MHTYRSRRGTDRKFEIILIHQSVEKKNVENQGFSTYFGVEFQGNVLAYELIGLFKFYILVLVNPGKQFRGDSSCTAIIVYYSIL